LCIAFWHLAVVKELDTDTCRMRKLAGLQRKAQWRIERPCRSSKVGDGVVRTCKVRAQSSRAFRGAFHRRRQARQDIGDTYYHCSWRYILRKTTIKEPGTRVYLLNSLKQMRNNFLMHSAVVLSCLHVSLQTQYAAYIAVNFICSSGRRYHLISNSYSHFQGLYNIHHIIDSHDRHGCPGTS
jgi:hypothetical protein